MKGFEIATIFYIWAALWVALIAIRLPDAPKGTTARVSGAIVIGAFWPITLPMHLSDYPRH